MGCAACERIESIRRGEHPNFVAELRRTFAVLHDHQPYPGWTVLLLKDHHEHFDRLDPSLQREVMDDISDTARAVRAATDCRRINYECLGNVLAHVHWHIVPRFAEPMDPNPRAAIWIQPESWLNADAPGANRADLLGRLRLALAR